MDNRISARCYRVSIAPPNVPDFHQVLLTAGELPQPGLRESNLGRGVRLRLERSRVVGNVVMGDFCRKQTRNIPNSAHDAGLAPIGLPDGHGLGHVAAFIYHIPTRVLLLQNNRQCATPNRIALYVAARSAGSLMVISPIVHPDTMGRLGDRGVRTITVNFASVENLGALEREGVSVARAAREAAQAYGANSIEITLKANLERGSTLNDQANPGFLRRLLGNDSVTKLEVKAVGDDRLEPIDLIEDKLFFDGEVELPEADPEEHFAVRVGWLDEKFRANLALFERLYGRNDADGR